jgi:hypothetical protein
LAARILVLAGGGEGRDGEGVAEEEGARWRRAALRRFEVVADAWLEEAGGDEGHARVLRRLGDYLGSWQLAPVRSPSNLKDLPEAERSAWSALWERIRETYERLLEERSRERETPK